MVVTLVKSVLKINKLLTKKKHLDHEEIGN